MQYFKKQTAAALDEAINQLSPGVSPGAAELAAWLEYPPDPTLGDLAFPCFRLAKAMRNAPPKIAASLAELLADFPLGNVKPVGPYLNFRVGEDYLMNRVLPSIEASGDSYGSSEEGAGKTVVLDYSSPNICKPFHIGHLGTTVIGHSLKLLHEFAGYRCVGVNHLGDWGTQFGKQIVAFRKWGDRETVERIGIDELVRLYVRFHEEAEKDPALEDEARTEFHKMEEGDPENLALWQWFVDVSIAEYKKTYRQLGIEFEHYTGESFYIRNGYGQDVVDELREKKLLKLDDGAQIVDLSAYNMPPCLIVKKDGSSIYHTRDIAAAEYRK
ncbi:MAG: arginine--tRNA ligase, partial [Clostridia bacterium]|nr:arginine--tRNA ligase [Clostridia bacterium]